jgi:hypothetical protein
LTQGGNHYRGGKMKDLFKKTIKFLAVVHPIEAVIAYRVAQKKGKDPKLYAALTLLLGVFVLVPLLRSKEERETCSQA